MTWRPHMRLVDCLQAGRDARERAIRFFADAAACSRAYSLTQHDEAWESFEVNFDMAFAELKIAHYWTGRADQCLIDKL